MIDVTESELVASTGCLVPCSYKEFRFLGQPEEIDLDLFGFQLKFAKMEIIVEKETWLFEFESFVSEFGGALGLFLGFSFLSLWNIVELMFSIVYANRPK